MTPKTEKFFIFTWKELTVFSLLSIVSAGFFFTLGLHYGKKINAQGIAVEQDHHVQPAEEDLPPKEVLEQASQNALVATEKAIEKATKEAILDHKVKVDSPKQVDLPAEKPKEKPKPITTAPVHSHGGFALQLGSFPTQAEANTKQKQFAKSSVKTEIATAKVHGQIRYRIVIAGFANKQDAIEQAKSLRQKKKIDSFVVIKL